MGFVIDGFLVVGVIVIGLWLWSLRSSAVQDAAEARAQAKLAEEARERDLREARLARPGEPLRCLNCNQSFLGPMADTGCPSCHMSAFVIPEHDVPSEAQVPLSPKEH